MKNKILLLFAIIGIPLAWAALEYDIPNNILKFGDGGAVNDKELVFNVGDGASNPKLVIDATNKDFTLNKALKVGNALLQLGTGSPTDITIELDYGLGGSANPKLIYKATEDAWFFRNANGVDKRIGSGGGGGKNVYNQLSNPGFEDGVTASWTASGLVPTELDAVADVGEGLKSVRIDCNGAGQYYESSLETFANIVTDGYFCQADFKYKGGDNLWDVKIIDGSATELASKTLTTKTKWGEFPSISFRCDSLGSDQAKIRFICTGDAAQLDLDEVYLGNQTGLTEGASPDVVAASIDASGNVLSESFDFIDGNCSHASAVNNCTFKSGFFSVAPSCNVTADMGVAGSDRNAGVRILNATTLEYRTDVASTGVADSRPAYIVCIKQGVDAAVSRRIFLNAPKVANNINIFSAKINTSADVVLDENVDWISGNGANVGTGAHDIGYISSVIATESNLNCTCTAMNTQSHRCVIQNSTSGGLRIQITNDTATAVDGIASLSCERRGADYKTVEVQPIVIDQVETSSRNGKLINECRVTNNAGTPEPAPECDDWITSITDNGVGNYTLNFSITFGENPTCVANVRDSGNGLISFGSIGPTGAAVFRYDTSNTASDGNWQVICIGER